MTAVGRAPIDRLGFWAATLSATLIVAYAIVLLIGFVTLPGPEVPIGDPWFTLLELLILALMPCILATMAAVHVSAPADRGAFSLLAFGFACLLTAVTCVLHFCVLTLSRQPAIAAQAGASLFLAFRWPSLVYALDILAWDVFFPLMAFAAAFAFTGWRLDRWIRWLLVVSGGLAVIGLLGVVTGDMQIRNIGIVGYVGVFLPAVILMALRFRRADGLAGPGQIGGGIDAADRRPGD